MLLVRALIARGFSGIRMDARGLASEILEYLHTHPHAIDCIDGIASHWLSSADVHPADVQRVLDELAAEGLVERIALSDGRAAYGRLAHARS
jgi:aryl-alcohol dehydrogenase-like predicted oxidoreductase